VALVGPGGQQTPKIRGIVDTGADRSLFPVEWAGPLGIDLTADCEEMVGMGTGGKVEQYHYTAGIHGLVFGHRVPLDAIFNAHLPVVLLGREDFMQYFKVSFDQRQKTLAIEPYDE
jgi:hypothetical protein